MRRLVVLAAALVAALGTFVVSSAEEPSAGVVQFPADFALPIYVGDDQVNPNVTEVTPSTTTTIPASTSTAATTTTSSPPSTEAPTPPTSTPSTPPPASTSTTSTPAPTTTAPPAPSGCGLRSGAFCEDFTDPGAFAKRFDHGVSGDLHAGCQIGDCRDGWPGDHDMSCGNPNMTHRTIVFGAGHMGEDSPASASDPGFYPCLPSDDPAKGHLMTSLNTAGYVIEWFSPKGYFADVKRVCFDNNLTYLGNGEWFQLVFLTPAEATAKPNIDGRIVDVMDLGYTSPDFPHQPNFPSSPQGTAGAGVKFMVNDPGNGRPDFVAKAWQGSAWASDGVVAGPATTDKAPRYQICTTDNGDGTLTVTNGSPDGTVHTSTMAGSIPNGPIRVVLEHDEYNPDKHHDNNGGVGTNQGEGYTYHWDNVLVETGAS